MRLRKKYIIELYKLNQYDKAKRYDRFMATHSGTDQPVNAEGLLHKPKAGQPMDCPAFALFSGFHHKIRAFGYAVLRKVPLLQRHPPGSKIRVACALPRL